MKMKEYYSKIYSLSYVPRYSNIIRIRTENVAEHSFFVAAIVLKLHERYEFILGDALQAAISHDIPEADITDITHKIKQDHPTLNSEIKIAEMYEIRKYPPAVRAGYEIFEFPTSPESLIVHLADVIQVEQYVTSEIKLGNEYMLEILVKTEKRRKMLEKEVRKYERPEYRPEKYTEKEKRDLRRL